MAARAERKEGEENPNCRFKEDCKPMWLCKFMRMGMCERGEQCTFAHNYDELHMASPDLPGSQMGLITEHAKLMEEINQEPDLQWKKKVHLCSQFERGECLLGK